MKLSITFIVFLAVLQVPNANSINSQGGKKKMVCYYGSWSVYRPGAGKFEVEDLDPFLCTHVIYSFAGLSYDNTIVSLDPYNDLHENYGKGAMLRFTDLKQKNPKLRTLLAVGGWTEGSEKYSKMVSDRASRAKFTASVVDFLLKYNFDGLDFDWEYPGHRGGINTDKENFILMIKKLKTAFEPHGSILTAAVSSGKSIIDIAYDVPAMSRILDHIHLMGYDYHGGWETHTGHHSPLYANPKIDSEYNALLNQDFSVNYWIEKGADPSKIILGMGSYGRGFTLNDPAINGFYAKANQPIPAGPYTREAGIWGYNEICEKLGQEHGAWKIVVDPYYMAPYAYKGNQWIGYDDPKSVKIKAQYAVSKGLGGAMVWSVESDDFRGTCHGNPFVLIKTISETLNGPIAYPSPMMGKPNASQKFVPVLSSEGSSSGSSMGEDSSERSSSGSSSKSEDSSEGRSSNEESEGKDSSSDDD